MKKLAISIMTYNRPKHIREDLAVIAQATREYGIDLYIYDGSTDMRTEQVVNRYIEKGYSHIHYHHASQQLSPVESVVARLSSAFKEPDAEYVWLCGDKFIIRPEHYAKIFSYIDKSYDIITIYGLVLKGTKEFRRASKYADYAIVPLTLWGATIIRREWVESFDFSKEYEKNASFCVPSIYLQAVLGADKFKGAVIDAGRKVHVLSRYDTRSISLAYMWSSWLINWYRLIESLPSAYDDVRENLYNRPDLQMHFFSLKDLLWQRSEGQFNGKKCWECKKYVKKVIVMPFVFVFLISMLPQNVAKWLWLNIDYGKEICNWAKNGVRVTSEKLRGIQGNL